MIQISGIVELRAQIAAWRSAGERIGFVPTMGNLHPGHLALVRAAAQESDRVVVSVFVNPTQFAPGEDLDSYPRTLDEDITALQSQSCDLLFAPQTNSIYPGGFDNTTTVEVPGVSGGLCGAARPGHFRGVATVVTRLFNIVQPDLAVFGEKDFQQLLVIKRLVEDLALPVEIVAVPTVRGDDGLAMSSRNGFLDVSQRTTAPLLYQTLKDAAEKIVQGPSRYREICRRALERLALAGFEPEYLELRNATDLSQPTAGEKPLILLIAARLGNTRLIDNLQFSADVGKASNVAKKRHLA